MVKRRLSPPILARLGNQTWGVLGYFRDTEGSPYQPTRAAETPARAPETCLTVVTTAKMTAIANAIEKAAKTKRGTIPRSLIRTVLARSIAAVFAPRDPYRDTARIGRQGAIRPL